MKHIEDYNVTPQGIEVGVYESEDQEVCTLEIISDQDLKNYILQNRLNEWAEDGFNGEHFQKEGKYTYNQILDNSDLLKSIVTQYLNGKH